MITLIPTKKRNIIPVLITAHALINTGSEVAQESGIAIMLFALAIFYIILSISANIITEVVSYIKSCTKIFEKKSQESN